ncbi:UNVERIFIED_CONTAM: hypothetical protein Sradi_0870400 [Sesamum radiatum]|uniref:Uncharacterized protein n=1 Tax=Sesamum radiatum TaxID=300843 RepID=A0AAW2V6Z0_SESRA
MANIQSNWLLVTHFNKFEVRLLLSFLSRSFGFSFGRRGLASLARPTRALLGPLATFFPLKFFSRDSAGGSGFSSDWD